jgi:hypothetical protein
LREAAPRLVKDEMRQPAAAGGAIVVGFLGNQTMSFVDTMRVRRLGAAASARRHRQHDLLLAVDPGARLRARRPTR